MCNYIEIRTIDYPIVHLVEVFCVLNKVQGLVVNVVFWSEEDAYRGLHRLLGINSEMEAEGFVVETILANLDQHALGFLRIFDQQTVADGTVELIEVRDQFVHDEGLDRQFGEDDLVLVVRFLVHLVSEIRARLYII